MTALGRLLQALKRGDREPLVAPREEIRQIIRARLRQANSRIRRRSWWPVVSREDE